MHRFDDRLVLRQTRERLGACERRAARERELRELRLARPRRSRTSLRRGIARALIGLAARLEPAVLARGPDSEHATRRNEDPASVPGWGTPP